MFLIGEKPKAFIPNSRRNLLSVAAGKICGCKRYPKLAIADEKTSNHGLLASVFVIACLSFIGPIPKMLFHSTLYPSSGEGEHS